MLILPLALGCGAPPDTFPERGTCGARGVYAACREDLGRDECLRQHGRYARLGLLRVEGCLCPSSDGGCPCARASDCEAGCVVADEGAWQRCDSVTAGTCAVARTTYGCVCELPDEGPAVALCAD